MHYYIRARWPKHGVRSDHVTSLSQSPTGTRLQPRLAELWLYTALGACQSARWRLFSVVVLRTNEYSCDLNTTNHKRRAVNKQERLRIRV